jgi:hypothetical protein
MRKSSSNAHSIVSCPSTEATNWLSMKSPVLTLMVLPVAVILSSATCDMVGWVCGEYMSGIHVKRVQSRGQVIG